jgi:hypothetical protein
MLFQDYFFCCGLIKPLFLCRVIGAVVIVTGLYLVLWGKSKDQPPSDSSDDKAEAIVTQTATEMQEKTETVDQEFVAIDITKVRRTDESI